MGGAATAGGPKPQSRTHGTICVMLGSTAQTYGPQVCILELGHLQRGGQESSPCNWEKRRVLP